MPSQIGNCHCCKCDDCKCKVILYKCGGSWSPAPRVECKKNTISGRFSFDNSYDCGGCVCCVQKGCTISKICLDKTYVFKFRIYGHLEKYRAGMHIGEIFYRKICTKKNAKPWKKVVSVSSPGGNQKCCLGLAQNECRIKLGRGKYEFKFTADSVDGEDHCGNFLQYDVKWCKYVPGKDCCPTLPEVPEPSDTCCSTLILPCCPEPQCTPSDNCTANCDTDPCVSGGWIIVPVISLA